MFSDDFDIYARAIKSDRTTSCKFYGAADLKEEIGNIYDARLGL